MPLSVFVDSDVVISSLISDKGAAFILINQAGDLKLFISNISKIEQEKVVKQLNIKEKKLTNLLEDRFTSVNLKSTNNQLKLRFKDYVYDINDAHIVAGASFSKAKFLITYNTKDYKANKIKDDFGIILTTPSNLLQYLRST